MKSLAHSPTKFQDDDCPVVSRGVALPHEARKGRWKLAGGASHRFSTRPRTSPGGASESVTLSESEVLRTVVRILRSRSRVAKSKNAFRKNIHRAEALP